MNKSLKKGTSTIVKPLSKKIEIDNNFCFKGIDFTVKEMQEALDAYRKQKKSHSDWLYKDDIPIFVDANVLLNIYFSPVPLREHMSRFLQDNKSRLFIVNQVETEFMRHRLEFIDKYKSNLTKAASKFRNTLKLFEVDFSILFKDLITASVDSNFIDSIPQSDELIKDTKTIADNDNLLSDRYGEFLEKISLIKDKFEEEYHKLYEKIDIEYNDPILSAISQISILPPLSQTEYDFTKALYENLLDRLKNESDTNAVYLRFPGCGENKNAEEKKEPWGDLLIYHQILLFMAKNNKDVIFLTNDISKSDWVKNKKGEPFSYYIADAYRNTRRSLFIIPVDDFLPKNYKSADDIFMDEDSVGDIGHKEPDSMTLNTPTTEINELYHYKAITEDDFLNELEKYSMWAEKFGENYVSESYFINIVLGHQQYRFSKSKEMLKKLSEDGKVELYQKGKDGYQIPSIRLVKTDVTTELDEPRTE